MELERANAKIFPGDEIFKLYATYGFPADLIEFIAQENEEGTVFSFGDREKTQLNTERVPSTNDDPKYEWRDIKTKLLAIASEKGGVDLKEVTSKSGKVALIIERTPLQTCWVKGYPFRVW